jgi:hypothetical protein
MKHKFCILLISFISFSAFSQDIRDSEQIKKQKIQPSFFQFDVAVPLIGSQNRTEGISSGSTTKSWFLPDGFSAKFGYGYQPNKWLGISIHSGIDWKASYKLVAVPVYGNLRISPRLGNETRLTAQVGFGQGFALGRGNLNGNYAKVSLGIETSDDLIIFIEGANYSFNFKNEKSIALISLGIALRTY